MIEYPSIIKIPLPFALRPATTRRLSSQEPSPPPRTPLPYLRVSSSRLNGELAGCRAVWLTRSGRFEVVNGAGWHDWNGDTDVGNIYYAEYSNSGTGASGTRVSWSKKLSSAVSQTTVLGSGYTSGAWYDGSYPN